MKVRILCTFLITIACTTNKSYAGCEIHLHDSIPLTPAAQSYLGLLEYYRQRSEPHKARDLVSNLLQRNSPTIPFSEESNDSLEVQLNRAMGSFIDQIDPLEWKTKLKRELELKLVSWQNISNDQKQAKEATKMIVSPALVRDPIQVLGTVRSISAWLDSGASSLLGSISTAGGVRSIRRYLHLIDPARGQVKEVGTFEIESEWRNMFAIESADNLYIIGQGRESDRRSLRGTINLLEVLKYDRNGNITKLGLPQFIDNRAIAAPAPLEVNGKKYLVFGFQGGISLYRVVGNEFVNYESVQLAEEIVDIAVTNADGRAFIASRTSKRHIFLHEVVNGRLELKLKKAIFDEQPEGTNGSIRGPILTAHGKQILMAIGDYRGTLGAYLVKVFAYDMESDRSQATEFVPTVSRGDDPTWVPGRKRAWLSLNSGELEFYEWTNNQLVKRFSHDLREEISRASPSWAEFEGRVFAAVGASRGKLLVLEFFENKLIEAGAAHLSGSNPFSRIAWRIDDRQAYMAVNTTGDQKINILKLMRDSSMPEGR